MGEDCRQLTLERLFHQRHAVDCAGRDLHAVQNAGQLISGVAKPDPAESRCATRRHPTRHGVGCGHGDLCELPKVRPDPFTSDKSEEPG